MEEGAQPRSNYGKPSGNNRQQNGNNTGGGNNGNLNVQQEIVAMKQEMNQIRNTVGMLEQEKDSLRKAIRKLKVKFFILIPKGIFQISIMAII